MTWKRKKQNVIVHPIAEAEFRSMAWHYDPDSSYKMWVTYPVSQSNCSVIIRQRVTSLIIQYNIIVQNMSKWTNFSSRRS